MRPRAYGAQRRKSQAERHPEGLQPRGISRSARDDGWIPLPDRSAREAALRRWDELTKPRGSLGRLEELGTRIATIRGETLPRIRRKVIFTAAADHGVAAEGVSAYPQSVTAQMVLNFLRGGAAINVLARHVGAEVVVVDAGVAGEIPSMDGLVVSKVRRGTGNMLREPAMTREEALRTVEEGRRLFAERHRADPIDLVGLGDMGIGNTTSSAALTALFTGRSAAEVTGRGTGIEDGALRRKVEVVQAALERHRPDPADPIGALAKVGGLEIAFLAGVTLAAAGARVPVVVDGFITTAAALAACAIERGARDALVASHCSAEPGHAIALKHLGLEPLLDLKLRLGEGTGAALAFFLIEASCKLMAEMATFSEAGVDGKKG